MTFFALYFVVGFIPFWGFCVGSESTTKPPAKPLEKDLNCHKHVPFHCEICEVSYVLEKCSRVCLTFCRKSKHFNTTPKPRQDGVVEIGPGRRRIAESVREKSRTNGVRPQPVPPPSYPIVSSPIPDMKFLECCQKDENIPPGCYHLCNFNNLNQQNAVLAYVTNSCPVSAGIPVFNCANSRADHTRCCKQSQVHLHHFGVCLTFCNSAAGNARMINAYACLALFPQSKHCYQNYILREERKKFSQRRRNKQRTQAAQNARRNKLAVVIAPKSEEDSS